MYRRTGMEPNFSTTVRTDVFITPADEKQRKWTNNVKLSVRTNGPRGNG